MRLVGYTYKLVMHVGSRDSFRKISKGGGGGVGQKHIRIHFGGACVQWVVFNFEGLQFLRGGTKFSRRGGMNAPPPLPP